jgi:hypothetical protein
MNRYLCYSYLVDDGLQGDAYWDMSPLQYAQSRGFQCMTDEVGEEIKRRARRLVATEALKEKK